MSAPTECLDLYVVDTEELEVEHVACFGNLLAVVRHLKALGHRRRTYLVGEPSGQTRAMALFRGGEWVLFTNAGEVVR